MSDVKCRFIDCRPNWLGRPFHCGSLRDCQRLPYSNRELNHNLIFYGNWHCDPIFFYKAFAFIENFDSPAAHRFCNPSINRMRSGFLVGLFHHVSEYYKNATHNVHVANRFDIHQRRCWTFCGFDDQTFPVSMQIVNVWVQTLSTVIPLFWPLVQTKCSPSCRLHIIKTYRS